MRKEIIIKILLVGIVVMLILYLLNTIDSDLLIQVSYAEGDGNDPAKKYGTQYSDYDKVYPNTTKGGLRWGFHLSLLTVAYVLFVIAARQNSGSG